MDIEELKAKKIIIKSMKINETLVYKRNIKNIIGRMNTTFNFDKIIGKKLED